MANSPWVPEGSLFERPNSFHGSLSIGPGGSSRRHRGGGGHQRTRDFRTVWATGRPSRAHGAPPASEGGADPVRRAGVGDALPRPDAERTSAGTAPDLPAGRGRRERP